MVDSAHSDEVLHSVNSAMWPSSDWPWPRVFVCGESNSQSQIRFRECVTPPYATSRTPLSHRNHIKFTPLQPKQRGQDVFEAPGRRLSCTAPSTNIPTENGEWSAWLPWPDDLQSSSAALAQPYDPSTRPRPTALSHGRRKHGCGCI